MKTNKLFRLFMAICISFSLIGATSIQAQENNIKISEDGFAIVYADLNRSSKSVRCRCDSCKS